ncbi:IS3 family transposase [Citrobacter sp. wls619]|uniref:IS3 family transposase n=1 Tax=Citrobacter sp. wls619 TaxID=2576432 RepID=UPI0034CF72F8
MRDWKSSIPKNYGLNSVICNIHCYTYERMSFKLQSLSPVGYRTQALKAAAPLYERRL